MIPWETLQARDVVWSNAPEKSKKHSLFMPPRCALCAAACRLVWVLLGYVHTPLLTLLPLPKSQLDSQAQKGSFPDSASSHVNCFCSTLGGKCDLSSNSIKGHPFDRRAGKNLPWCMNWILSTLRQISFLIGSSVWDNLDQIVSRCVSCTSTAGT